MKKLKDKSVIVYDHGSQVSFAQMLSKDIGTVYYFNPGAKSSYPAEHDAAIGEGMEGLTVIYDVFDYVREVDAVFFLDLYHDDLADFLISLGIPCWSARKGEEIETKRTETKKFLRKNGFPVNKYEEIKGFENLRKYLQDHDQVFVKFSRWRGDGESFYSENYKTIKNKLDAMEVEFGALAPEKECVVEQPIEAVCEVGLDIYSIDGRFPENIFFGYEIKDCGYAGTVKPYKEVSPLLTDLTDAFRNKMRELQYRSDFSTEHRITKKKISYCIDIVAGRKPSPPSEVMQEIISNWSEIMLFGAMGQMIEPVYEAKFGVQIIIHCDSAKKNWVTIEVPEEIRRWIKLKNVCYYDDAFQYIPQNYDMIEIGSVVAIGNTLDECVEKVKEYCGMIKGNGLEMNCDSIIKKLNEQIAAGESVGIEF